MIEVFVCDDDENITEFIKFFIMKHFGHEYHVITMNSCKELLSMVEIKEYIPDILIMDINLNDGNGIETVGMIQAHYPCVRVIYLTGVINFATSIFETNPAYFLIKPINENKLSDAITKVGKQVEADKVGSLILRTNGSEMVVQKRDIVYIESQGRKLIVYISGRTNIELYEKMDVLQEQLGSTFVRSHKSYLINMRYISERTNKEFLLSNGKSVPISKPNLKEAKVKFITYLGEL